MDLSMAFISNSNNIVFQQGVEILTNNATQQDTKPRAYTKDNPFLGRILSKRLLSRSGSNKETMHYEIDISGSDISYNAGDCFGFMPVNNDNVISEILRLLKKSGNELIKDSNDLDICQFK